VKIQKRCTKQSQTGRNHCSIGFTHLGPMVWLLPVHRINLDRFNQLKATNRHFLLKPLYLIHMQVQYNVQEEVTYLRKDLGINTLTMQTPKNLLKCILRHESVTSSKTTFTRKTLKSTRKHAKYCDITHSKDKTSRDPKQ
jgi:hypothetical protein